MAEPDNLILVMLRELRSEPARQDKARTTLEERFDSIRDAVNGESFMGRCLAAEIEEQLAATRARLDVLEAKR